MFIHKTLTAMLIGALLFGHLLAQQTGKISELSPELQKNALEFLRQTIKEIPSLKATDNRQFFAVQTARLLWKYDEKESRRVFEQTIQEVKQSIAKSTEEYKKKVEEIKKANTQAKLIYATNTTANVYAVNTTKPTNSAPSNKPYSNAANRAGAPDEISLYETGLMFKFRRISTLREFLIGNLTEIDPALAFQFLSETEQMLPKDIGTSYRDTYDPLEKRIVARLLQENKVDKSVEIARTLLEKDFSQGFLSVLTLIYQKDPVKGGTLAEETLQKLKTPKGKEISNYDEISSFFEQAVESREQMSPMLTEQSLRELAKLLGQEVLAEMQDGEYYFYPPDYAKTIEKYAPRQALQIMQKAKQKRSHNANRPATNTPYYPVNRSYPANYPVNYTTVAVNKPANPAVPATNTPANRKGAKAKVTPTPAGFEPIPVPNQWELTLATKAELFEKLKNSRLNADERKKIVAAVKEYVIETNPWGYGRQDRFVPIVTELARFAFASADPEVAEQLLKEAEVYVRPETKNYVDYISKLMLAVGYSTHHPAKSFAVMESLTSINQVIESAVNLGVFIDTQSEFIEEGEVSVAMFLGERRFLQEFYQAEFPLFIRNLAQADFKRTRGLADKFEKPEVRMTAKILILESLLGEIQDYSQAERIDLK